MKKIIILSLLYAVLMTACGGSTETDSSNENTNQFDPSAFELPLSSTLAIGTIKLDETDQAVTSDQAVDLLPLWQVLNSLNSSDRAAPEEILAILEQIQETMTAEQLATIDEMELTREDVFNTMRDIGGDYGSGEGRGEGFSSNGGPGGGFPGGGPPGGGPGGGGFGGQDFSPEQIATAQARRAENGGGFTNRVMTPLVDAVINLLESKAE